jgi:hypothetical protein
MKTIYFIVVFTFVFYTLGFSQTKFPISFKVDKQSMSTPMSSLEDMFFANSYDIKPVNIKFDGSLLNMYYDNGATFVKKNVTEVSRDMEYDDDNLAIETMLYTDNENVSDTISLIVDHSIRYIQLILPTKNTKGDYIGYTSFKKFVEKDELALK